MEPNILRYRKNNVFVLLYESVFWFCGEKREKKENSFGKSFGELLTFLCLKTRLENITENSTLSVPLSNSLLIGWKKFRRLNEKSWNNHNILWKPKTVEAFSSFFITAKNFCCHALSNVLNTFKYDLNAKVISKTLKF